MEKDRTLKSWAAGSGNSLKWLADRVGVSVSAMSRWASGESLPDADMVDRIVTLTEGAVTAEDMHAVRLAWLRANRPEKFLASEAAA